MKELLKYIFISIMFIFASCTKSSDGIDNSNSSGKGGSMARFTIAGDYLYVVDDQNLKVFDIGINNNPVNIKDIFVGFSIETIFTHGDLLFIGSQWGMYIYDISSPGNPSYISEYNHIFSCDPVVVNDTLAFVTLRAGTDCRTNTQTNQLDIIDISNPYLPKLITTLAMSNPKGLGIDSCYLFICDDGLKIFDFTKVANPKVINHINNIETYDVIPHNRTLYVVGPSGFYQYNYEKIDSIYLLSSFPI